VFGDTRDCPGTVTLSASSSGALIDWYADADAASSFYTGVSYITPEIYESTTYYVQARFENTGCLSSARVPVLAEVNMAGCCDLPGVTGVTFAEFNPCPATVGSTWTLTDARDGKQYKTKYMADGRYWMVQDLKFGNCTLNSYNGDGSEAATTQTPTVADGYVGHCRSLTLSTAGYHYTWAGIMNNTKAYSGASSSSISCVGTDPDPIVCRGACPSGWHVPTRRNLYLPRKLLSCPDVRE
jgi:hypothetical protein